MLINKNFQKLIIFSVIIFALSNHNFSFAQDNEEDEDLIGKEVEKGSFEYPNIIKKIEKYMNTPKVFWSNFVQVNNDKSQYTGVLYIKTPGKMRMEYIDPVNDLVVSNSGILTYVDFYNEKVVNIPLSETPAQYILRDPFSLSKDVNIISIKKSEFFYSLEVEPTENKEKIKAILYFSPKNYELLQWTFYDAQKRQTTVRLKKLQYEDTITDQYFSFTAPSDWEK